MSEFPRMVYVYPAAGEVVHLQDGKYGVKVVADKGDLVAAFDAGFHLTPGMAREAYENPKVDEVSPPTRAELEHKAKELGIKFDGRTSDKKLSDAIDEKLKA